MPFLPLLSYVVHVLFQEKRVEQHQKRHSPDCPACAAASTASCMFTLSVATGSAVDTPPDASSDAEATTATGATTPVPPGSATVSAPSTCVPGCAPVCRRQGCAPLPSWRTVLLGGAAMCSCRAMLNACGSFVVFFFLKFPCSSFVCFPWSGLCLWWCRAAYS